MTTPSVFVVDDEPSVQTAFIRLLASAGYQVRGFLSARAFLDEYRPAGPGCLVLDLQMPDITGLDLLEMLRTTDPALGVVFVSGRGDVPATAKAMKMGAADFLTKPVDDAVLLGAVASASQRSTELWIEREEHARLSERHRRLTPRERQVCDMVARGQLNKQIAFDLGTSEKTVKIHRGRVMVKLGVESVAELVRFVDRLHGGNASE